MKEGGEGGSGGDGGRLGEGGREGGRGGEGRGGEGGRREGCREGGRDDCYTYSNSDTTNPLSFPTQSVNSKHVTYYVITCKSAFDWVYAEQWYVIGQCSLGRAIKVLKAGVKTSYVHSSKGSDYRTN